jgi:cation:H+ antiporter
MGSSLFNLLILGILDLSHHSRGRMLSRASAAHALSATLSIALTAIAAMSILIGTRAAQTFVGLGIGSWALLITYVLGVRMVYYDQRLSAKVAETSQEVLIPAGRIRLIRAGMGFALAALVIVVASPHLARSAAKIADETGLGGAFVGTTLVALCTSLPELVVSLTALRLGAFDMAVGNVCSRPRFLSVQFFGRDLH